jgi:hypothetical protein
MKSRTSTTLRMLILAGVVAVAAAVFTGSALASGTCTPPPNADGWYCAALALSNNTGTIGVSERLVDDYFRDPAPVVAPTSEGFVDDSWRSTFVPQSVEVTSGGFDWGDFGIGAAAAIGAVLLALGLTTLVSGHRPTGVRSA